MNVKEQSKGSNYSDKFIQQVFHIHMYRLVCVQYCIFEVNKELYLNSLFKERFYSQIQKVVKTKLLLLLLFLFLLLFSSPFLSP